MENLSHTVSKTAYNGNGFGAKSVYDDVFGGPPKFGVPTLSPRTEDYAEIFGGFHASRASSIPILDLPAADEADDYSYDIRSSHCDYSEVFGGFSGLDFAISFEELTNQSKTTYDSSDEAWTPAQSETFSDESELSACSERYQSMSNVESFESCDGIKQLKVSYSKAGNKSKDDMSNGVAHVTQLHDVPGYSFIVNETPPSRKIDARNTPLHVNDDLKPNADSSGKPGEGKRLRKTVSCINRPFVTVSDINLRTRPSQLPPPSRPPPVVGVKNEDFDVPNSKLKACKTFAFGESSGHNSPPFYDVQIDASSSAAVSAAAMKDVMEKAQAKLKSAMELKERNKEGLQSHKISGLKDHENDEVKASKKIHGSNCFTDERVHETSERDFCRTKIYAGEEKQKLTKREEGVSSSIDGEHINVARLPKGKVHVRECGSFQESIKTEGIVAWRQDEEFYEVVETDESREIFNVEDNRRFVVHNLWSHEHGQQKIATPQQEEDNRKMKSEREMYEWDGNKWRLKESKQLSRHDEHEKKVKVNEGVCRQKESGKQSKMAQEQGDIEKIITETVKGEEFKYMAEVQQKENGVVVEKKLKEVTGRTEDHRRYNYDFGEEENEKKLKGTLERERYEKRLKEATERAKTEKRLKEALERREKENKQVETCERKEKEKGMKEVLESEQDEIKFRAIIEQEETEKRLTLSLEQEENEEKQNLASKRDEAEERHTEDLRRQEMEVKQKGTLQNEENTLKQKESHRRENNVERPTVSFERREKEKKLKEGWEQEENMQQSQEAPEKEEHEKSKIDFEREEIDKECKEANEFEANKRPMGYSGCLEALKERSIDHEHNERKVKSVKEGNFGVSDGACKLVNDYENLESGQAANMEDMNSVEAKKTEGDFSLEKDGTIMGKHIGCEVQVERSNLSGMVRDDSQPGKNQIGMKDANESLHRDDTGIELDEDGIGIGQSMDISKKPSNVSPSPGNPNIVDHELGERDANLKKGLVGIEKEEREVKLLPSQVVKQLPEEGGKMRADQPTVLDNKRNVQSASQKVSANQNTERKGKNLNNILTQEEKEKEERINRERELENDRLRKIEEEREREREREKDGMAVDIAFLEARDRAAVERATSEVRQRALAEARERLEKASMEARLRAERAAVERATAEARERAFQKAKAEKASAEARERVERTRQSSLRTELGQGVGSANGSIYSYSSGHSGAEGESPQRCKARLERHQRTAERAAKALAEKNLRDFVAQREQAERNRLAEGLDAEVKRWSSGKEGNLRALLSTLQYILGSDSGWHPIPLTEVITSAAVKRAYRKATLCVHPDKLQQRGASIHQKYICEKVFDLLKEAWNKFNSEER